MTRPSPGRRARNPCRGRPHERGIARSIRSALEGAVRPRPQYDRGGLKLVGHLLPRRSGGVGTCGACAGPSAGAGGEFPCPAPASLGAS